MTVSAFVITYRRPAVLQRTLAAILEQTHTPSSLIVLDNGQCDDTRAIANLYSGGGVEYRRLDRNMGPAGAAAIGCREAAGRAEWVYWVDDDDPPRTVDTIERLVRLGIGPDEAQLGAVGASGARWSWRRGELERLSTAELHGRVEVDAIGAGCQFLLRSDVIERVGYPNEALFFGYEEIEYCLRLRRAGYKLVVDGDLHRKYRSMAGRLDLQVCRSAVPAGPRSALWRTYYGTRNYIHFMRSTFGRPDLARRQVVKACGKALLSFRRGPRYGMEMSRLQLAAIADGYMGKLGLTVAPQPKTT